MEHSRNIDWQTLQLSGRDSQAFCVSNTMTGLTFHIWYPWGQHCVLLHGYAATQGPIADPATPQRAPK